MMLHNTLPEMLRAKEFRRRPKVEATHPDKPSDCPSDVCVALTGDERGRLFCLSQSTARQIVVPIHQPLCKQLKLENWHYATHNTQTVI